MYITSQYVSYIRNIEFKVELKSYKCVIQGGYTCRGSLSQTYLLVIFAIISYNYTIIMLTFSSFHVEMF
jgi:hypothetical protein